MNTQTENGERKRIAEAPINQTPALLNKILVIQETEVPLETLRVTPYTI